MLMITVKCALMVGHFEIDEIEVFVDITPSTINNAKVSSGLSGVYWQQPQLMGLVNFATVETSPIKISARTRAGNWTIPLSFTSSVDELGFLSDVERLLSHSESLGNKPTSLVTQ